MTSTGRNQPCPCGSGAKYKHCCEDRDKHPYFSRTGIVFGIAILVILAGGVAALLNDPTNDGEAARSLRDALQGSTESAAPAPVSPAPATTTQASTPEATATPTQQAPVPQPPGPAPEGKVWSTEHGHWHNAPPVRIEGSREGLTASAAPGQPQPGMVWNEEHGHYHRLAPPDGSQANTTTQQTSVPLSQIPRVSVGPEGQTRSSAPIAPPPGPAPEGKVWSYEHGHWHNAQPTFPSGDLPAETQTSDPAPEEDPQ